MYCCLDLRTCVLWNLGPSTGSHWFVVATQHSEQQVQPSRSDSAKPGLQLVASVLGTALECGSAFYYYGLALFNQGRENANVTVLDPACETTLENKIQAQDRGECSEKPPCAAGPSSRNPEDCGQQPNEGGAVEEARQLVGQEEEDDDGNEQEEEEEGERQEGEEEEEEDDLQLAWNMLEIAKIIYARDEAKHYMELSGEPVVLFQP